MGSIVDEKETAHTMIHYYHLLLLITEVTQTEQCCTTDMSHYTCYKSCIGITFISRYALVNFKAFFI
jgi:hypothetical protein